MAQTVINKELMLASYCNEVSLTDDHIKIKETPLDIARVLGDDRSDGDVVVKNEWLSVDPCHKLFFKNGSNDGLRPSPSTLNQPITSILVGKVVASANEGFEVGDIVTGFYQAGEYSVVSGSSLRKLDTNVAKPLDYLGPLGIAGLTAWAGFLLIGDPKPGEEVFVTAAAGAVGLLVGQLAKIKGCRVVGSVGSDHKVKMLKEEFGFDDAFNYKTETDWDEALSRYFPRGIDIYFDNVGGVMLEAVVNHINMNARIPICGMISQYNEASFTYENPVVIAFQDWKECYGVRSLLNLVGKCGKMQGFLCGQYMHLMNEFTEEMSAYMREGRIKYKEVVKEGIQSFVEALNCLYRGENTGKVMVHLTPS